MPMGNNGGIGFSPGRNGVVRPPFPTHHSVYPKVDGTRRLSASPFKQDANSSSTSPRSEPPPMRFSYMQRPLPSPPKDAPGKMSIPSPLGTCLPSPGGSDLLKGTSPLVPSSPLSPLIASRRSSGIDLSLQAELASQLGRRASTRRGVPQLAIKPTTVVCLDIGGTVYKTTWKTLNAVPSYFSELFFGQQRHATECAPFFIDRNPGDHIDMILTYLRYKADSTRAVLSSAIHSAMTTPRHSQQSFMEWFSPVPVPIRIDDRLRDDLDLPKSPEFLRILITECRYYGLRELKMLASDLLEEGERIHQQYGTWRCVKLRAEEIAGRTIQSANSPVGVNNDTIPVPSSISLHSMSRSPSPSPYRSGLPHAFSSDTEDEDEYNSETSLEDAIDATVDSIKAQLLRRRNALKPGDESVAMDAVDAKENAEKACQETAVGRDDTQDILAWYDAVSLTPSTTCAEEVFMLMRFRQ